MKKPRAFPRSCDVFVVGGGPAGLAVAMAACARGLSVVVADGARPPIDKACGEGLLPDGAAALETLDPALTRSQSTFAGIRFLSGERSAEARFSRSRLGLAIRRTSLHQAMLERAASAGAELLWETPVEGISGAGVQLGDRQVRARWVVGADGSHSRVRRWAGLDAGPRPRLRYAFRRHFRVAPWTDHMEVYWGEHCQGYATAVSHDQVCVALASRDPHLRLADGLSTLPGLGRRLQHAEVVSAERGAVTGNRQFHRVCRGPIALVGDASGTVDAITGEGLGLAFRQALDLARCLEGGDLSPYQAAHRQLMRRPLGMARLLLLLDRRPHLQRRALAALAEHPEIFRRFLELHLGDLAPLDMVKDGLNLGWGLLTA
jgi:menaquinone-9 beta-reductase